MLRTWALQCYEFRCYNAANLGVIIVIITIMIIIIIIITFIVIIFILEIKPNFSNVPFFKYQRLSRIYDYPRIFQMSRFFQISWFSGLSDYPRVFQMSSFFQMLGTSELIYVSSDSIKIDIQRKENL